MFARLAFLIVLPACLCAQNTTTTAQNATSFALTYGYPLLAFQKLASIFISANRTNEIINIRQLSGPEETTVVRPNFDTLYSTALIDLSQSDLILTVPEVPQPQFVSLSFYDPFGDNFANIVTGEGDIAGKYRLRAPQNGTIQEFGLRGPTNGTSNDIYSPTFYGTFLARWHVNNTNLDALHKYQDQTFFTIQSRTTAGDVPRITSLDTLAISKNATLSPAEKVLQLLSRYAPWNQPETATSAQEVQAMLQAAGISNGTYKPPISTVDLELANQTALTSAASAGAAPANNVDLDNGWSVPRPGVAGNFNNGTNYPYRAFVANTSYLMLTSPTAIYPKWVNSSKVSDGEALYAGSPFLLSKNESIVYTFSRKPVLRDGGFWSLTAYAADNFLIPNKLERYELGDRSNITYPNGTNIYESDTDGQFEILVQTADNPPPANWTSNWLPGPSGGGEMTAYLRLYLGQEEMVDGSYVYPVIRRQAAITGGNEISTASSSSVESGSSSAASTGTMPTTTSTAPAASSSMATTGGAESMLVDFSTALVAVVAFLW